jgi:putative membrane protein
VIDVVVPSAILLVAYSVLTARTHWPARRTACFAAGLLVVGAGASLGDSSLALHMAGHGLLVAVGAPLLVLGRPVTLALRALPRESARELASLLRKRTLRALLWPPLAWSAFVGAQLAFHLTPLFESSLREGALHESEHAIFLATALWLWTVCLAVEPLPVRWPALARGGLLLAAMMASDVGSVKLMVDGETAAGAVMTASMMPMGLAAAALVWGSLLREERLARRREVAHATG